MHEDDVWLLEVTDLKQWRICQRVVYYRYCLPHIRPVTGKMEEGIREHQAELMRELRRSLRSYGLAEGERHVDIRLRSTALGLTGRLDVLVVLPEGQEGYIVEHKLSDRKIGAHVKLQLAAYALLVEEAWGLTVARGFLYRIPLRRVEEVTLTSRLKRQVRETVTAIQAMVRAECMPPPPARQRICVSCEFRRFCNDVLV
jgi:CRISPR-associated exonuclease Cas4